MKNKRIAHQGRKEQDMNTAKEAARIRRSIKKLSACDGDCKHCEHAQIKTARGGDRHIYYAFYCDVDSNIQPYSNTLRDLRDTTLDALMFELA
jgi:hypothetical protein